MGYKVPLGNVKEYIEHCRFTELFNAFVRVEKVVGFVVERTSRSIKKVSVKACLP